jgi:hypothetical protein
MPSKPNYNHQRAERNRAKQAKKEEKLQNRKAAQSSRNAEADPTAAPHADTDLAPSSGE